MTLAAAVRALHDECIALLIKGIDPKKQEQDEAEQEKRAKDSLFVNVATRWFAIKKTSGISEVHTGDIWHSLERDVFPVIGQIAVADLKVPGLNRYPWLRVPSSPLSAGEAAQPTPVAAAVLAEHRSCHDCGR
ncbi:phage integrase central domain-containing protein [Brenneria uluponensis]|uniref:phage integrase central domain-containing protein n=1 Tax=Brenneria uluponensis TaxID=3057057 RepID=UPI003CCC8A72